MRPWLGFRLLFLRRPELGLFRMQLMRLLGIRVLRYQTTQLSEALEADDGHATHCCHKLEQRAPEHFLINLILDSN